MSNVTRLSDIKANPRTIKEKYHGYGITVQFDPDTKAWQWQLTKTIEFMHTGTATTMARALAAAKKSADLLGDA